MTTHASNCRGGYSDSDSHTWSGNSSPSCNPSSSQNGSTPGSTNDCASPPQGNGGNANPTALIAVNGNIAHNNVDVSANLGAGNTHQTALVTVDGNIGHNGVDISANLTTGDAHQAALVAVAADGSIGHNGVDINANLAALNVVDVHADIQAALDFGARLLSRLKRRPRLSRGSPECNPGAFIRSADRGRAVADIALR